jgi:hypothetical protein
MSAQGHSIVKRENPNDIFITPPELANKHIQMVLDLTDNEEMIWYDPFKNTGNYFNNYPQFEGVKHEWSEILEDRDFFKFNGKVDCIVSNPPYSLMNEVIDKSIALKPQVISFLIGNMNLTPNRIQYFNERGYYLAQLHFCKIYEWFSNSFIVSFKRSVSDYHEGVITNDFTLEFISNMNCISFDPVVYHDENIMKKKEIAKKEKELEKLKKQQQKQLEKEAKTFRVGDTVKFHRISISGVVSSHTGIIKDINRMNAVIESDTFCCKIKKRDIIEKC